jgi:hypothetical protein
LNHKLYILSTIIACSFLQVHFTHAQTFKVNLSSKHISKINEGKSAREKLKKYRKFYSKDSAKQMKKLNKQLQKKADSITRTMVKKEKLRMLAEKQGIKLPADTLAILNQYASLLPTKNGDSAKATSMAKASVQEELSKEPFLKQYTSLLKDTTLRDSLKGEGIKLAKQNLEQQLKDRYGLSQAEATAYFSGDSSAKKKVRQRSLQLTKQKSVEALPPSQRKQMEAYQKEYGPYSKEVKQYLYFLKDSIDTMDTLKSLASPKIEALSKDVLGGQLGSEAKQINEYTQKLDELKKQQADYKKQVDEYNDPNKLKDKGKKEAEAQLQNYVGAAEKKMSLLKNKYSTLLNSNDLSTGIKEKSLKGRPLRERWVIGGNFNITSTAPLMIDLAPQFGYRIDKRWQVGVSGIYRAKFVDSVRVANAISPQRYGFSVFSSYSLILNFFGYAEWEQTVSSVKSTNDRATNQWVPSLLVGIGKKFQFHPKVGGTIMVLWDPLHVNGKSPYNDAFVIKTGFQLSELAMKKK